MTAAFFRRYPKRRLVGPRNRIEVLTADVFRRAVVDAGPLCLGAGLDENHPLQPSDVSRDLGSRCNQRDPRMGRQIEGFLPAGIDWPHIENMLNKPVVGGFEDSRPQYSGPGLRGLCHTIHELENEAPVAFPVQLEPVDVRVSVIPPSANPKTAAIL